MINRENLIPSDLWFLKHYSTIGRHFFMKSYYHLLFKLKGKFFSTLTIKTKQGLLTVSTKDSVVGPSLYRDKQHEYNYSIDTLRFLKTKNFISSSNINMLDIGAMIGHIGIGLALENEVDLVLSIEPDPYNWNLLNKNIAQNNLSKRLLGLQLAAGDKASTVELELSSNFGDHRIREKPVLNTPEYYQETKRKVIKVKALSLPLILELPEVKKFGFSSPSIIWIDVQGYEGYVFKGGKALLEQGIPTVAEIWPYGILRSGMGLDTFSGIVKSIWTDYWIEIEGRFIRYPIDVFDCYLEQLGTGSCFNNVIFTKRKKE